MKFQVGDKVKYESGDWWFYGTVTAVIENSISPCYRLIVDRMEKKNCKFSITQFEFELAADMEIDTDKGIGKWESLEMEYLKKIESIRNVEHLSQVIEPPLEQAQEAIREPEPVQEPEPEPKKRRRRKLKQQPEMESIPEQMPELMLETVEAPQIQIEEKKPKERKNAAWERNLEAFKRGEKSNIIYTWITQNRRLYNTGNLKDDKLEKLIEIDFPFKPKKKRNSRNLKK